MRQNDRTQQVLAPKGEVYNGIGHQLEEIRKGIGEAKYAELKLKAESEGKTLRQFFKLKAPKIEAKNVFGKEMIQTRGVTKKGYITLISRSNSSFYNPLDRVNALVKESLENGLNYQQAKEIEHKKEAVETMPLDFKRCLAMKYIKQFYNYNEFLRKMARNAKRYPLTEAQCDCAIRTGKEIKSNFEQKKALQDLKPEGPSHLT